MRVVCSHRIRAHATWRRAHQNRKRDESIHIKHIQGSSHSLTILMSPAPCRMGSNSDRKSTRLNSSHQIISYAVFCLKKNNNLRHRLAVVKDDHDVGRLEVAVDYALRVRWLDALAERLVQCEEHAGRQLVVRAVLRAR